MIKNYLKYLKENHPFFKMGDKVVCISPKGALMKDKIYTLTSIYDEGEMCGVDGDTGWFLNRFEPADKKLLKKMEEMKEKDYIEHMDLDPYGEEEWYIE